MLQKPPKLCKTCNKSSPHTGRRECLLCIQKKEKERVRSKKQKDTEKIKTRKVKATTKKRFSRSSLIKEADRVFSLYVRDRDKGIPCITCGVAWDESFQCGHFMSRRHLNTRWVKTNAHGQCPKCNLWGSGEQFAHAEAIDKLYGPGQAKNIQKLAQNTEKTTDAEILDYIRTYYQLLADMGVDCKPKKYYQ